VTAVIFAADYTEVPQCSTLIADAPPGPSSAALPVIGIGWREECRMLNLVWLMLLAGSIVVAGVRGQVGVVSEAVMASAKLGVETVLGFVGVMALWLGLMRIAQEAGLIALLGRGLRPVVRLLFPTVPPGDAAEGAILMNLSANILGAGSAATPLGLKAMQELQRLNSGRDTASNAMITFMALNTSCITLVPATVIAFRAQAGSLNPAEIVGPTIMATACSTIIALTVDAGLRRWSRRRHGGGR